MTTNVTWVKNAPKDPPIGVGMVTVPKGQPTPG